MAFTISVSDFNKDGTGINFAAYLSNFEKNYVDDTGRGGFSGTQSGVYGSETNPLQADAYAITDDASGGGQSVIFNGPGNFKYSGPYSYNGSAHNVYGELSSISFGQNTEITDLGGGDVKYSHDADIKITGFSSGYMTDAQTKGELLHDISNSDTSSLTALLATDSIIFKGSTGKDVFTGYGHADKLNGGAGNDKLGGGAGKDRLNGDTGNDVLTGGTAADTFYFAKNDGTDRISDFAAGRTGADIIEFQKGLFDSYADVIDSAVEKNGNTVISYTGGSLTLIGVEIADLHKGDFHLL